MKKITSLFILGIILVSSAFFTSQKPKSNVLSTQTTVSTTPTPQISRQQTLSPSIANTPLYPVVKVVDGDTISVKIDGKKTTIRLIGINTPETVDPRKSVQCFGKEASNHAKEILTGKEVKLVADPTQDNKDKYGRLLRYVFLPDGTNFNLQQIADGYAFEYTYDIPYEHQSEFKQAEQNARENNKGLWAKDTCNGELKNL